MALEKTFNNLITNLNRPLLFFVPLNLIPKNEIKKFHNINLKAVFDRVIFYNNDGEIHETLSQFDYIQLLSKPHALGNNVLKLVDEKATLNKTQFEALLEQYALHLRFFVYVSNWMNEHVSEYCEIDNNIKSYFKIQKVSLQNHKQEVETKFGINIAKSLKSNQILTYLDKNDNTLPLSNFFKLEKEHKNNNNILPIKKPTKENQKLITDAEARSYLLENVFHIKS